MLTAEPGLAKPFYGGIFDMHPVMDHGWIRTLRPMAILPARN